MSAKHSSKKNKSTWESVRDYLYGTPLLNTPKKRKIAYRSLITITVLLFMLFLVSRCEYEKGIYPTQEIVLSDSDSATKSIMDATGVKYDFVFIQGGTLFQMGSNSSDADEAPQHDVRLESYLIGKNPVTYQLWDGVMGVVSERKSPTDPVVDVSWNECQEFLSILNQMTGLSFRLPSEAEWEYSFKTSDGFSNKVADWCNDWYGADYYSYSPLYMPQGPDNGKYKVVRGYSVDSKPTSAISRECAEPAQKPIGVGFRICL